MGQGLWRGHRTPCSCSAPGCVWEAYEDTPGGERKGWGREHMVLGGEVGGYLGEERENTPRGEEDILEEESRIPSLG